MDTDLAEPVRDAIVTAVRRGEVGYPWGRAYPEALASFAVDAWDWSLDPDTVRHTADVMTGMAHAVRLVTPADGVLVLTTPVYPPFLDLAGDHRAAGASRPADRGRTTRPRRPGSRASPRSARRVGRPPWRCATPTTRPGWSHTRTELERLAGLAAELGVRVVVDEIHAPAGPSGGDLHSVPDGRRGRAGVRGPLGLEGLQPARTEGGPDRARARGGRRDHRRAARDPGPQRQLDRRAGPRGRADRGPRLARRAPRRPDREPCAARLSAGQPSCRQIRWQPPEATYLAWLDCRRPRSG